MSDIKKNAPQGATCYRLLKNGKPLYFDDNHNYWNWVSEKWIETKVQYGDSEIKPL